ncbi:hypothetical protein OAF56_03325 [Pirellulaceae bacterium]|nr:hypothetical protein [Pirellulaceae bacterium]
MGEKLQITYPEIDTCLDSGNLKILLLSILCQVLHAKYFMPSTSWRVLHSEDRSVESAHLIAALILVVLCIRTPVRQSNDSCLAILCFCASVLRITDPENNGSSERFMPKI